MAKIDNQKRMKLVQDRLRKRKKETATLKKGVEAEKTKTKNARESLKKLKSALGTIGKGE